ncbi:MAG: HipA N-terminal domain-containing protein [Rikenellaceae bacterium]
MSSISVIEVFIADRRVGRLALTPEGLCAFEYDAEWIQSGYSISPFYLPLKSGLQIAKRDHLEGGFGVFDDTLPSTGFNGYHTTTINGQGEPKAEDIIAVAKEVGISEADATDIVKSLSNMCKSKLLLK